MKLKARQVAQSPGKRDLLGGPACGQQQRYYHVIKSRDSTGRSSFHTGVSAVEVGLPILLQSMPGVDDVSSPQQQTSISTSPLLSPSDDRDSFLCLGSTNKDPRQSTPAAAQTSRINSTSPSNAGDISLHTSARKRRSSNGSNKLAAVPGNPLRQHSADCLAPNYRGVANSVNSQQQQYPVMQYRQSKDSRQQQPTCHEEDNRRFPSKTIDAQQQDKSNRLDYTKYRQATFQRATANYSLRTKQFFYQILSGCKNPKCSNRLCASCSFKGMIIICPVVFYR
jgi:hypothetical protein